MYNGKRNQGRQPKKWMDNVNEDMEAKKLNVQQATVLVWDRNKWKHQVAASSSLERWKRAEEEKDFHYYRPVVDWRAARLWMMRR